MSGLGDEGSASPLSSPPESLFDFRDNAEKASYHRSPHASKVDHSSIAVQMDEDTAEGSIAVRASNRTTVASRPKGAPANLSKKRKALTPTKVAASSKKARNEAKKWQSPFVYTDPKTPLARADLRVRLSLAGEKNQNPYDKVANLRILVYSPQLPGLGRSQ